MTGDPCPFCRPAVFDLRDIPPSDRPPLVFNSFEALTPGDAFELVSRDDPKPIYYELTAEHSGEFDWEYREVGPYRWRVTITRTA